MLAIAAPTGFDPFAGNDPPDGSRPSAGGIGARTGPRILRGIPCLPVWLLPLYFGETSRSMNCVCTLQGRLSKSSPTRTDARRHLAEWSLHFFRLRLLSDRATASPRDGVLRLQLPASGNRDRISPGFYRQYQASARDPTAALAGDIDGQVVMEFGRTAVIGLIAAVVIAKCRIVRPAFSPIEGVLRSVRHSLFTFL